ncbi:MAG: DUF3108 domain-containing protein [Bacteroidales bacterium]|nr:DUF3108 domain-containing protein [Bacteroidales bacterium]
MVRLWHKHFGKRSFATAIFLFLTMLFFAQNNCLLFDMSNRESVFQSGEKITYTLSYTVMGVWTNVGEVVFETTLKEGSGGRSFYQIDATGKSFAFFDRIFKVRDYFTTRIDAKTFQPFYMHRNIHEGSYKLKSTGRYDWANNVIHTTTQRIDKQSPEKKETLPLTPCTFDVVSLFYYYRNADFSKMREKITYNVQLVMDDKAYTIDYKFHGKQEQRVRGVGNFNTMKFTGTLIEGETFSGNEQITFWVTNDENRIPVYMEVPIRVGSIRVRIKNWENLKFPMTALKK